MTKLERIQDILTNDNFRVESSPLPACIDAVSLKTEKSIIVNSCKNFDSSQLYCLLQHEKKHFDLELFYTLSASISTILLIERKVEREAAKELVKEDELFDLLCVQQIPIWDIAEKLGVTEHIVKTAYDIYSADEKWIARQNAIIWEWEA